MFSDEYMPVEDAITVLLRLYSQRSKAQCGQVKESAKEGQGDRDVRKDEPDRDTKDDREALQDVIALESSSDHSDNEGKNDDIIWLD